MGFLHSSRARGRVSNALRRAAEVRYIGLEGNNEDSTVLRFEVLPFGEAATEFFQQQLLWEGGPNPEDTAFEVFAAALNDVAALRADSNKYDQGLLQRIRKYDRALKRGIQRIELPDTTVTERPSRIDAEVVAAATQLAVVTPEPRRVRITGRLDLMGASQGVLQIHVRPGEIVTALWDGGVAVNTLKDHFDRDVVVEGIGVFRPSGALLRVDADAIASASAKDEFFRSIPKATVPRDYSRLLRLRPAELLAYPAILQSIPGNESDEDFAAAVDDLS